ncbi:MAG: hypothetical protein U0795_18935 [Pirellulales bacterium]
MSPKPVPGEAPVTGTPAAVPEIADQPQLVDPTELLDPKLATRVTHEFKDNSLSEIAAWVQQQTEVNVVLDERSLSEANILFNDSITENLIDAPIYLLLDRLQRYGISWQFTPGMIYLRAKADQGDTTVSYNIGDLLDRNFEGSDLSDAIMETVDPGSWQEMGEGTGEAIILGDVLFVRQTPRNHRRVAGLLAALRKPARRVLIDDPQQHSAIRQTLQQNVSVNFQAQPLNLVIESLSQQSGTEIRLDREALKAGKFSERTPITLTLQDQPLATVLSVLATQLNLGWHLSDGSLWFTATDEIDYSMKLALFDVRDLCRNLDECAALQDAVEQQSDANTWESGEGIGTIAFPSSGMMVISQTEAQLDAVLALLENYRFALKNSKRRISPEEDPEGIETRYFRMPSVVADDLLGLLPTLVATDTWKSADRPQAPGTLVKIRSWDETDRPASTSQTAATPSDNQSYSVLVVVQKRRVHDEIRSLLDKVRHGDSLGAGAAGDNIGGLGGMGGSFGGGLFSIGAE